MSRAYDIGLQLLPHTHTLDDEKLNGQRLPFLH